MSKNKIKIIFFGTPEFAVPFLDTLIQNFDVLGVVTQPDRPAGRKQTVTPPPVKVLAEKNNIKVLQPETLKNNSEIVTQLKNLKPDISIVVAYGEMIPDNILNIPKFKTINVHPSLLPKYRGASPVQSAILNGDEKTGISIMLLDDEMDHGPILTQTETILSGNETNESLHTELAKIGSPFLIESIKKYIAGELKPCNQDHNQAIYCKEIKKEEARIDWSEPAETIERRIRAYYPWPITWTTLDGKRFKIIKALKHQDIKSNQSGQITISDNKLLVQCNKNTLEILKLQLEGKNITTAKNFISGYQNINGETFK